jgi:hypothetical protein
MFEIIAGIDDHLERTCGQGTVQSVDEARASHASCQCDYVAV